MDQFSHPLFPLDKLDAALHQSSIITKLIVQPLVDKSLHVLYLLLLLLVRTLLRKHLLSLELAKVSIVAFECFQRFSVLVEVNSKIADAIQGRRYRAKLVKEFRCI